MNTIGWLFVFVGALVIRFVSKGRGITDIPGDLGDILTGILTNDSAKIKSTLAKGNSEVTTPVSYVGSSSAAEHSTSSNYSTANLGNVKPILVTAANDIDAMFHPSRIIGVRADNGGYGDSEHSAGRAIDIFISGKSQGDAIANYLTVRPNLYNIKYVIWYQRIWYPGAGWRSMPDRGSANANHTNHVHLNTN